MKTKSLLFVLSLFSTGIISTFGETTSNDTVVKVNHFIQKTKDTTVSRVAITAERKTIELFARSNVHVLSHLIRSTTTSKPSHSINGKVSKKGSLLTASVSLSDRKDSLITSGKIQGTSGLFRRIRNVLAETILYVLDINERVRLLETEKKPTKTGSAYALYLLAKQDVLAEHYDKAISVLIEAIEMDPRFAMAYWTIAQLYKEKGIMDSASLWDKKAQQIDAGHPCWPYKDSINREQPLKDLLHVSKRVLYDPIDTGISYKYIELEQYGVTALLWVVDPNVYTVDLQVQNYPGGNYIEEFFSDPRTILAINSGFFEMDDQYTLSPSGLIISGGMVVSPAMERGGSGVFCIKKGKPEIVWAKENINPVECSIALQSGPVIVEHGGTSGVYANDYIRLNRSAVGISGGKIILAIILGENGTGLSLYEFAEFLRTSKDIGGAGCDVALNLDGGSSTQARLFLKGFIMNFDGLWKINSAIVVKKKK